MNDTGVREQEKTLRESAEQVRLIEERTEKFRQKQQEHIQQDVKHYHRNLILFTIFMFVIALVLATFINFWLTSYYRMRLAKLSNSDHGVTLEEFTASARKEGDVCYALFDSNGDKLFEYMEDYYGNTGLDDEPDWPDEEVFYDLVARAGVSTEVHWHPRLVPTSILDDLYVSAQVNSKQLIILEYDRVHYFAPSSNGWPTVSEMLNFQRRYRRNPSSRQRFEGDWLEDMLKHFNIQHEVMPVE